MLSPLNTCEFCGGEVFNDNRHVGSVRQTSTRLVHYHLDCLYERYPDVDNYQQLVIGLFKQTAGETAQGENEMSIKIQTGVVGKSSQTVTFPNEDEARAWLKEYTLDAPKVDAVMRFERVDVQSYPYHTSTSTRAFVRKE